MVDIINIYTYLSNSIRTVMKKLEMLKFVPDHLQTKKMCTQALKKLAYLLRYNPDQYKTQQMCAKAILENGEKLKSIPDCYKNQEMFNKIVDNLPS